MLKRKLPLTVVLPVIITLVALGLLVDDRAATAATETPTKNWNREDCLQCHHDLKTLHKMQDKSGEPDFCQAAYDRINGKKPSTVRRDK